MQTRQTCNSFSGPKSYRHVRETGATGLKTGVKNDIFWSEIGSGFERTPRYSQLPLRRTPLGPALAVRLREMSVL